MNLINVRLKYRKPKPHQQQQQHKTKSINETSQKHDL